MSFVNDVFSLVFGIGYPHSIGFRFDRMPFWACSSNLPNGFARSTRELLWRFGRTPEWFRLNHLRDAAQISASNPLYELCSCCLFSTGGRSSGHFLQL